MWVLGFAILNCNFHISDFETLVFKGLDAFRSKIEGRGSLEQNRGYRTPDHNRGRVAGAK